MYPNFNFQMAAETVDQQDQVNVEPFECSNEECLPF